MPATINVTKQIFEKIKMSIPKNSPYENLKSYLILQDLFKKLGDTKYCSNEWNWVTFCNKLETILQICDEDFAEGRVRVITERFVLEFLKGMNTQFITGMKNHIDENRKYDKHCYSSLIKFCRNNLKFEIFTCVQ